MFFYLFPLLFVAMWILVSFIISRMGWAALVASYPCDPDFSGERIGIISASINNMNYKNSLILKYNSRGMYLRPTIPFRLFHKPVLIPWTEIKEVRDKKILFFNFKELIIGQPFVAIVAMKKSTFERMNSGR